MKKFLVCVDGSEISERVIQRAVERAKTEGAELVILYVAEDFCPVGLDEVDCNVVRELIKKEANIVINKAVELAQKLGCQAKGEIREGRPADVIIEYAKEANVDEIFIGSHGRHGAAKVLLGSVSSRVVELAPCPVTVVK